MAKTSMKIKQQRPQKYKVREYTRCERCGRPHSVLTQVQSLPYLLPRTGLQGPDPGSQEGKLVRIRKEEKAMMNMTDPIADMLTRIRNGASGAPRSR